MLTHFLRLWYTYIVHRITLVRIANSLYLTQLNMGPAGGSQETCL